MLKKRIVDAELIYSTNEEDQEKKVFPSGLCRNENLLIIIKLSNGKGIGIFVQIISSQDKS